MPVRYTLLAELSLVLLRPTDVLTEACLLGYFDRLRSNPAWHPNLNRLIDTRFLVDIDMTYAQMRNIRANEVPPKAGHIRQVVFVCSDDLSYGMARMYTSIGIRGGQEKVHLVETLAEAALRDAD